MRIRSGLAAASIVLFVPGSASSWPGGWTPHPGDARQANEFVEYHKLVTAFRSGDDGAAGAIATWPNRQILATIALLPPSPLKFPAWDAGQFKAAVMMHTTAALMLFGTPGRDEGALLHLEVATDVLWRGRENVRAFVAPWHTAIGHLLLGQVRLTALDAFLEHARERFPDEPAIHFLSGAFSEYMAGPSSFEELATGPNSSLARVERALERISDRRAGRLRDAARWIGASVDPTRPEAERLLHLGRVEMLRGHDEDAVRLFREVAASRDADVEFRYLAVLFTGGLDERRGRFEDATASYREAAALVPGAQAARIALSQSLGRAGRTDESRRILQDTIRTQRPAVLDPWWTYFLGDSKVTSSRLKALLAEARE